MTDEIVRSFDSLPAAPAATAPSAPSSAEMFAGLMDLARDPDVDPAKMAALANLQISMMDKAKLEEFNRDKIAALFEMPSITKRGAITNKAGAVQSTYAKFEDIHAAVTPILRSHNLIISFDVGNTGNLVTVRPILSHANGHVERGEAMALPLDTTGSKNGTQGAGSAASYGKRHSMKAMLNIIEAGEDDDGASTKALPKPEEWQEQTLQESRMAAIRGTGSYETWFKSISSMKRGWLVDECHHQANKKAAAEHDQ